MRFVLYILPFTLPFGIVTSRSRIRNTKGTADSVKQKTFTLPSIPSTLTEPEERAVYLAAHYWENFDFSDTTLISQQEITEQALADFLDVPRYVPADKAEKALNVLLDSVAVDSAMFAHFVRLSEKYLCDPNSPYRNEELYIPVSQNIIASSRLDDIEKVRPRYQLEMALKNRPGDVATDFVYTLPGGRTVRMSFIRTDYTLLFFNNPDCPDCRLVKEHIKDSPLFNRLTQTRNGNQPVLAILAVYPDANIPLWKNTEYPAYMTNSRDTGGLITNKQFYAPKAIPTLYLLDKDKRVLLKDVSIEMIEHELQTP